MNTLREKTFNLPPVIMLEPQSYKVGDIVIPGDIKLFNRMWHNKEFDKINPEDLDTQCIPTMYRGTNRVQSFFERRKELTHKTAVELWESSIYYSSLSMKINKLLHTGNPLEDVDYSHHFTENMLQYYLSQEPEALMFREDNLFAYKNSQLLPIYRDIIARFQLLGNKTNDERTSMYLGELFSLVDKIWFIQTLSYYGLEATIYRFKRLKNNNLECDPETAEIMTQPNIFCKISYKEVLYQFYSVCMSPEKETKDNIEKIRHLGTIVLQYEDIRRLFTSYLLPMRSCIKQDKLYSICCQVVLSYLRPVFITEKFVVDLLTV